MAGYAGLGFCLGAAMLTKVTSVLLVPFIVVALASRLLVAKSRHGHLVAHPGRDAGGLFRRLWLVLSLDLVPFRHAVRSATGTRLRGFSGGRTTATTRWQTSRDLAGRWFIRCSAVFAGFADGIYSTLWGDGLCGGATRHGVSTAVELRLDDRWISAGAGADPDHPGRRGGFGLAVHSPTVGGVVCVARFFRNVVAGTGFHEPEGALLFAGKSILTDYAPLCRSVLSARWVGRF